MKYSLVFLIVLLSLPLQAQKKKRQSKKIYRRTEAYLQSLKANPKEYAPALHTKIDTLFVKKDSIQIHFTDGFAYHTLRPQQVEVLYQIIEKKLGRFAKKKVISLYAKGFELSELVPPSYQKNEINKERHALADIQQHVTNLSSPHHPSKGLENRHLALWNSHGFYFEQKFNRWEWQRARMFTTVEDLLTSSFVLPFLTPMYENAGANVYLPRERDVQTNELIIDNADKGYLELGDSTSFHSLSKGFQKLERIRAFENPFKMGDARWASLKKNSTDQVMWRGKLPEGGKYAVYISYPRSPQPTKEAIYTVHHTGGETNFQVDQTMGAGTWVYLGSFRFNTSEAKVSLLLDGDPTRTVGMDAVKFGGGMGNVERFGQVSKRPRWNESARYYLQSAGYPDSLVFSFHEEKNDYKDDYRSRGRWVNYLRGKQFIEPKIAKGHVIDGLNIPIDLSLAFHTDAGHHYGSDTIIGTLLIYSTRNTDKKQTFPTGQSRLVNRDFADLVSTQIVDDIRAKHLKHWTQRELWDKQYSEATYPNVPSVLLELMSHHNFGDMKLGLDPNFKFTVSRAIYKATLRFLSTYYQIPYVVQPLPIDRFEALVKRQQAHLSWTPTVDPLEPTAQANSYLVYSRKNDSGWDNGRLVHDTTFISPKLEKGVLYSFKVEAVNEGGKSFPSKKLSVCWQSEQAPSVLLVDGFDRVAAPESVEEGNFVGFASFIDEGVDWGTDVGTIGQQYEFDQKRNWSDDDAPGHGASYDDLSSITSQGNPFDQTFCHAQALLNSAVNISSIDRKSFVMDSFETNNYQMIDLIMGEQKTTLLPNGNTTYEVFSLDFLNKLKEFQQHSGNIFISGAYIGSDVFQNKKIIINDSTKQLVKSVLGYFGRADRASKTGDVIGVPSQFTQGKAFKFNQDFSSDQYRVESPDALEPANQDGMSILRYAINNKPAAIYYHNKGKVVALGFPFESIKEQQVRTLFMSEIVERLLNKKE